MRKVGNKGGNLIHCSNTVGNRGAKHNSELKGRK
tara:strand:- start:147 stop:248 length:102 start_codon:yes stop_codon:yes gene_type:complete